MTARLHPHGAELADPPCRIVIARSIDDILQAVAIRAAVYMAEQDCPYAEEFDGNDFAGATHLIGRVGDRPAACLRIRWFADFFKIERTTVLPAYRRSGVAVALMRAAIDLGRRKGYRRLAGHVSPDLLGFWTRTLGVRARPGRPGFRFSEVDYVEVELDLAPAADAVTIDTDPMVLLRPEGEWDHPGVLDHSAAREPRTQHLRRA